MNDNKPPRLIQSRSHPLIKQLHRQRQDPAAYRKAGQVWLEGEHLALALKSRGGRAALALLSQSAASQPRLWQLAEAVADDLVLLDDALLGEVSGLDTPAPAAFIGLLQDWPGTERGTAKPPQASLDSVVLDRLQDPGNVGTVLRSAAALGIRQVLALKGSAALWSPKVLRAGMGAHFALELHENVELTTLDHLAADGLVLVATSSHTRDELHQVQLPRPCAWVLGHEGQGVDAALQQRCRLAVRIPQPGGEESLNVAAAAAICFYETARQRLAAAAKP